ncbi:MAG TPA: methionine--tRNA ligase [Acidobacteriaceae bacterium]|nr:methionine--tRNA ligase [Acidobacteriaceae bacterium]
MADSPRFSITTPIYYVNARPHIGHAYSTLVTDAIARRKRSLGFETWFLTGTDEHGQKIERSAKSAGRTPREFADEVSDEFRSLWDRMGLRYDDFIRTTEPRHRKGVEKLFLLLKERGFIYKGTYTGQYCVSDELYVDAPPGSPCPDCGRITETVSEENYFFKLSAFERKLLELYQQNPAFIRPDARRNEILSFVRGGLKDLSISRTSFDWGIPVPGDEKHVIYVWMDALANYITALGFGSDRPEDQRRFERFWPVDLHIIGKEISRFHAVYWPAFLMAAGLPLPKSIVAHGWLLFEQSKMSKSRGNIVRTETILEVLGADALRYFLLREVVFGQDGGFALDALVQRYNSDLANGYGNLTSRTLAMIARYFEGTLPEASPESEAELPPDTSSQERTTREQAIRALAQETMEEFGARFEALDFSGALGQLWVFIRALDGYLTATTPWVLGARSDAASRARLATILYTAAESIRIVTALIYPVLPDSAARIWQQLGLGEIEHFDLKSLAWGQLRPGTRLGELSAVFPRAEKDTVQRMQDMEKTSTTVPSEPAATGHAGAETTQAAPELPPSPAPPTVPAEAATAAAVIPAPTAAAPQGAAGMPASAPQITIDDFAKVDLRVAEIKVAERIPKADKLLRLEVDLGYERRQILAGIAEAYAPESLIGRKVIIVANLAPRKLRGLESNGMIVAASLGEKGTPVLAGFLEDVELGARLK